MSVVSRMKIISHRRSSNLSVADTALCHQADIIMRRHLHRLHTHHPSMHSLTKYLVNSSKEGLGVHTKVLHRDKDHHNTSPLLSSSTRLGTGDKSSPVSKNYYTYHISPQEFCTEAQSLWLTVVCALVMRYHFFLLQHPQLYVTVDQRSSWNHVD
jgi:hypothetical protein